MNRSLYLSFFDEFCRIASPYFIRRNIFGYYRSSSDDSTFSNTYCITNSCIGSYENIFVNVNYARSEFETSCIRI